MRLLSFMLIAGALVLFPRNAKGQDETIGEFVHGQRARAMGNAIGDVWREGTITRLANSRHEVCWGLSIDDDGRGRIMLFGPSNTVEVAGDEVGSDLPWVPVRLDAVFEQSNCWLEEWRRPNQQNGG